MIRAHVVAVAIATVVVAFVIMATDTVLSVQFAAGAVQSGTGVRATVAIVGAVYWITGLAVFINSERHSSLGCLLLNLVGVIFVCSTLLSIEGASWAKTISFLSAASLPPLLLRSYRALRRTETVSLLRIEPVDLASASVVLVIVFATLWGVPTGIVQLIVEIAVAAELLAVLGILCWYWMHETQTADRAQLGLVALGSLAQILVVFGIFAIPSVRNIAALWVASSVLLPLVVCVLVVRGHLMDTQLRRSFVYLLLTAAFSAAYVGVALALWQLLRPFDGGRWAILPIAAVSLLFVPLLRSAQRMADFVIYRDNYDFRGVLRSLVETIPLQNDSDGLGRYVCVSLVRALNLDGCVLVSIIGDERRVVYAAGHAHERQQLHTRVVPLTINGRAIGELIVSMKRAHTQLRSVDEDLLRTVAFQTAAMLENFELIERLRERVQGLREAETRRRELHRKLTESEENTRAALSRELHDGTLQSILHLVRMCDLGPGDQGFDALLDGIADLGRDIAFELRHVCADLRPHILDQINLSVALDSLVQRYRGHQGLDIDLDVRQESSDAPTRIDKYIEVVVYRIVNEALSNITRHSGARHTSISVTYLDDRVEIEVADDGIGFRVEEGDLLELSRSSHMGVVGMFERVRDLDGTIRIMPGASGTLLFAAIPIARDASEPGALEPGALEVAEGMEPRR